MNYLNKLASKLKTAPLTFSGVSEAELDTIKHLANRELPEAYVEFLRLMGKSMQRKNRESFGFLTGIDIFFPFIPNLKKGALELLKENASNLTLSDNDYVFYSAQGCDFAFFKLNEGPNPPVYYYREGQGQIAFKKIANSFSEFLIRFYDMDVTLFK